MHKEKHESSLISFLKLDIIQEFFFSSIGCVIFIIIYFFFPKHYWKETYITTMILILTLSFFFIFIIFNQIDSKRKTFEVNYKRNVILFSIFNFAGYLFLFYHANWGYNGLVADNTYRTAYITQMAHSGYPQDFAYKGLSAFYSPFYWYCLALLSIIFLIPPYKMMRIGLLILSYIMPIILFEIWKKIYEKKIAFLITVISSIFLFLVYAPDHMIGVFLFVPYVLYYLENCTNKEFTKKDYILSGIFGAIALTSFFLYFLAIPIYYLIKIIQNKTEFKNNLKHLIYNTFSLLLFSSWFWVPLLRDIILIGFESHQNRYFHPSILYYPLFYYFRFNIWGFFNSIGIVYIIRKYKNSRDLKILGDLIISIHILFFLGFIGIFIGFPIMHARFYILSTYILLISSAMFYVRFFKFFAVSDLLKKYNHNINMYQIEIYLLLTMIVVQLSSQWSYISRTSAYDNAYRGNSLAEERDIFEELDYEEKVFLTNEWRVAMFLPIYLFLLPNPYYSHPCALYNKRVEFLVELSECETSKEFYNMIIDNEFGPIDYFYLDLEENNTKLTFDVAIERFPDGRDYYEIEFDIALFQDDHYFKEIEIEDRLIYRTKY